MHRVATYQLVPGMAVAENIYNFNNQLVLSKGTILTDDIITRLEFYSIISIYVEDELHPISEVSDPASYDASEGSYSKRLQASPQFQEFKVKYECQVADFHNTLTNVIEKNIPLNTNELMTSISSLLTESSKHASLFDMLHNMREYSDSTYSHCINVALICNAFSKWMNFSEQDAYTVTLCGLMHDIGKLAVPLNILNKPAKLTDEEYNVIKQHPINGYRVLLSHHLDTPICTTALLHHEKCDGSGYPYGLLGHRLDRFTKMVTIADIYDAMTSARVYRGPLCPFKVVELIEEEGYQKYDPDYLLTFLSHIVNTYISYRVRLNNGQEGEVIYINKNKLGRPTLKCGNEYIDLSAHPELEIQCII